MKLVAIDFETANSKSNSACSLGITIFDEGELVDSYAFFIKPPRESRYFTNTFIHHITLEDVNDKPEFDEYYDDLKQVFDGAVLVAHNARFDIGVLNSMCDSYNLEHFRNPYIDTVTLSRRVFPNLINHRLNTVSEYLGVELNHHEASSDAYACMMIVLSVMNMSGNYDIVDLMRQLSLRIFFNR